MVQSSSIRSDNHIDSSVPAPAQAYFEAHPSRSRPQPQGNRPDTASTIRDLPGASGGFGRGMLQGPEANAPAVLDRPPPSSLGQGLHGQVPFFRLPVSGSDLESQQRSSPDLPTWEHDSSTSRDSLDLLYDLPSSRTSSSVSRSHNKGHSQRRPSNRDEFDGPHQYLDRPSPETIAAQERELPHIPTNLLVQEQDDLLGQVNDRLSQCAFDFVAKYQFPIPLEADKRPVRTAQDREWTEWVYLLKRLATKRRIPARVLYNSQIKQLVTVLENSLEMRHAAKHQSRPLKDDRNVLQLISAGLQVAKILKDAASMEFLDRLYIRTELLIQSRRGTPSYLG